jgi:hypothetical protein
MLSDLCNCHSTHELYFTSLTLSLYIHPHACLHTYQMSCSIHHVSFFVLSLFCPSHFSRTQYYWNQTIIQIRVLIWSLQMIALVALIILTVFYGFQLFSQINNSQCFEKNHKCLNHFKMWITIHDYSFISFYTNVTITTRIRYYVYIFQYNHIMLHSYRKNINLLFTQDGKELIVRFRLFM